MPFSFSFFLFFVAEGEEGFGVFNFRNFADEEFPYSRCTIIHNRPTMKWTDFFFRQDFCLPKLYKTL